MWFTLLALVISCILVWLYVTYARMSTFWARRNVPHIPPHPILGSLTILQKKNIGVWMREIYQKFQSPYVGIYLLWRPALVVNNPEIARRILIKDSDIFRDRYLRSGKSDPIGGLNILTVNDPVWSSVRRRLTSVFTTAKLKHLQPLISTKAKELCQRITEESKQKKKIDMRNVLTDYSTDIIGTTSFGVECNATLTGDGPMRRITKDFQTYSPLRGIGHACIFFFPDVVDFFRFSFFPKHTVEYFRRIFNTVVDQRGGYNKPVEGNRDLLDALLKMRQDAIKDKEEMSNDLLIAQAAIFVQGGFETTSGTLTFTIYELAYNPDIQEKLYHEILEIKNKLGDADFDMDSLAGATYLNCIIKETLRIYPPMGWLDRIASKEYQIDENLTIPAGTPVYVNAIAMQMDPKYFSEPTKFIPERFSPENEKNIVPYTYSPFGEGPRVCIGQRFAHQTMRFALANLIWNFEVRPWAKAPKPNECEIEKFALFLMPGEVLSVEFVPRN